MKRKDRVENGDLKRWNKGNQAADAEDTEDAGPLKTKFVGEDVVKQQIKTQLEVSEPEKLDQQKRKCLPDRKTAREGRNISTYVQWSIAECFRKALPQSPRRYCVSEARHTGV
jgi:hypothetical protein